MIHWWHCYDCWTIFNLVYSKILSTNINILKRTNVDY